MHKSMDIPSDSDWGQYQRKTDSVLPNVPGMTALFG